MLGVSTEYEGVGQVQRMRDAWVFWRAA